tara:strand:- start:548 stop:778 length:231 start_codon:yes stop_codon:yes gene_type:complete
MSDDIHPNDFLRGDMVRMLDMSCQGIVIKKLIDDAGTNFYYVFWYAGDDLYDPPFEDITWGADLKLVSRGINNEKR